MSGRNELEGNTLFGKSGFDQGDQVCFLARVWIVNDSDRLRLATFLVGDFPSLNALELRNKLSLSLISRCLIIEKDLVFRIFAGSCFFTYLNTTHVFLTPILFALFYFSNLRALDLRNFLYEFLFVKDINRLYALLL